MRTATVLTALPMILIASVCPTVEAGNVEVAVLNKNNWHQYVPKGKEVDAIYGDIVLRNDHLVAVIAQPLASRNANMTVRDVGGCLIDLTERRRQSDQLSCYYPGKREYPFRSWEVKTQNEKTELKSHEVNDTLTLSNPNSISVVVTSAGTDDRAELHVRYSLTAQSKSLQVFSAFKNTTDKKISVRLEDDARIDGGKEDMTRVMAKDEKLYVVHDQFWNQAYGFLPQSNHTLSVNASSRTLSFRFFDEEKRSRIELEPTDGTFFSREIHPADNAINVLGKAMYDRPVTKRTAFHVVDSRNRPLKARIELFEGEKSLGTANTDFRGFAMLTIPSTKLTASVFVNGITVAENLPVNSEHEATALQTADFSIGHLDVSVTDEHGRPSPCKVELIGKEETPAPNFGPETAEYGVKNLRYAPHGSFRQALHPGKYEVIISRGPEFNAVFREIEVQPGKTTQLKETVSRAFETPGWISADFHSHSSPSGDNTGSQFGRVLNLVCENVEYGPCTEHNRISSYVPHIDKLGIGEYLGTVSGMELTGSPLPLNHQNVFPLIHKPRTQDGGGPVTDTDPEKQIERIVLWDDRSEKLIQQNHPDLGWLFFDKNGDGKPDAGYSRSFLLMDVMEIHPIDAALNLKAVDESFGRKRNHRIFNWLQLLNQGHRIPGVVNTDAHYNFHGSGGLRNWIKSPTDRPDEIEPLDVVHASEKGQLIMSNGPYLEVKLSAGSESVGPGDDVEAKDGNVTLDISVKCPNWFDVDRVFVLVNGRIHDTHDYRRKSHSKMFNNKETATRFHQKSLKLSLKSDAHIVVVTGGENSKLGPVQGPGWGQQKPAAMSNPIFVDVDGGGFKPNGDTLDADLPVKFGTKK